MSTDRRDTTISGNNIRIASDGTVAATSPYSFTNSDIWDFPGHRKMPHPPTPTAGSISRTRYDVGPYTRPTGTGKAAMVGTPQYCWPTEGKVVSSSSRTDALADLIGARRKMGDGPLNLATALGDIDKTAEMVAKRARQLAEAAFQLSKGNAKAFSQALGIASPSRAQRGRIRDSVDRLADNWLEYTYGWAPLIADVYGGIDALHKGVTGEGKEVSGRQGKGPSRSAGQGLPAIGLGHSATSRGTVINPTVRSLQELGLLNPFSLAWELLPYSFVADWFLPIGDIFAGITSGLGLKNVQQCIVYENRQETLYHSIRFRTNQSILREAINTSPNFALLNAFSESLGTRRMISAISLVQQRFGRSHAGFHT